MAEFQNNIKIAYLKSIICVKLNFNRDDKYFFYSTIKLMN